MGLFDSVVSAVSQHVQQQGDLPRSSAACWPTMANWAGSWPGGQI